MLVNHPDVLYKSKTDEWETPQATFDELNQEFGFTLDVCASSTNHKCEKYFTIEDDGLKQSWLGETVWCNPPYSDIATWVKKAYEETRFPGTTVVMLIPARTSTKYFHNYIIHRTEIRFVKGRLKFGGKDNAPFSNMIVIFRGPGV